MNSSMPIIRSGVERLETLSDLCALEISNHGMLETKRALLLEESLLADGNIGLSSQQQQVEHGKSTANANETLEQIPALCDVLADSSETDEAAFSDNVTDGMSSVQPIVRSKKSDPTPRIKRPMNPFMIWAKGERSTILSKNPTMHNSDVSRQLGRNWRSMSLEEKRPYISAAERLAEEHKRLHPNYKYRPRKKDPNVQRVRGRRLDSEALNRVAKALTKQEISACVSGNGMSFLRRAARPSSVTLSRPLQPQNQFETPPLSHSDCSSAHSGKDNSKVKQELVAASAPTTPVRDDTFLTDQQRRLSHPNSAFDMATRERGWYSCPPSPSSFSGKFYQQTQPSTIPECRGNHIDGATVTESPRADDMRSPPPLVDCGQYQASNVGNCPPPLVASPQQQQQQQPASHQGTSNKLQQPTAASLSYQHYSVSNQQSNYGRDSSTAQGNMQYDQNSLNQPLSHAEYTETASDQFSSAGGQISPPLDHRGTATSAEENLNFLPLSSQSPSVYDNSQPPSRGTSSPSQISSLATKILTIMVKRGDEDSTPDDIKYAPSHTADIAPTNNYQFGSQYPSASSTPGSRPLSHGISDANSAALSTQTLQPTAAPLVSPISAGSQEPLHFHHWSNGVSCAENDSQYYPG